MDSESKPQKRHEVEPEPVRRERMSPVRRILEAARQRKSFKRSCSFDFHNLFQRSPLVLLKEVILSTK